MADGGSVSPIFLRKSLSSPMHLSRAPSREFAKLATSRTESPSAPAITLSFLRRTGRAVEYAVLMGCIALCWFGVTVTSPFLLPYAISKDIPASAAGALFAMQPFAVILVQPIVPFLGERFGYRFALGLGLVVGGVAMACFAAAPSATPDGGRELLHLLVASAALAGFGEGIVETSVYALLQQVFPDVMGQVSGHAEAWIGIGTVAGPAVGGALFAVGGFAYPTAVTAAMMLVLSAGSLVRSEGSSPLKSSSLDLPLIGDADEGARSPDVCVFVTVAVGNVLGGAIYGAFCPITSDYYVDTYGWSTTIVGAIFGLFGAIYMAAAMYAGVVCDRGPKHARGIFCGGCFACSVSMLVAAWPSPWVSVCGVQMLGAGTGFIMVPVLTLLSQNAPAGVSDGFTASVLNGGYALGLGSGPLLAVPLFRSWGYQGVVCAVAAAVAVLSVVIAVVMLARPQRRR